MRVLLVKPSNLSDHIQPSLGLGYLAARVRDRHEVRIFDSLKEGDGLAGFRRTLREHRPDVIGIQCYTFDLGRLDPLLRTCREVLPDATTIIGGPHPTAAPADGLNRFGDRLDFAFAGEGEIGFPAFLDAIDGRGVPLASVPNLVWRDGGTVRENPREAEPDLDKLGMPAWDLLRPEEYPPNQHGMFFRRFPIAPLMATRGCPFLCTFCGSAGTRLRKRSVDAMMDEVRMLYHERGVREFHVVDDNFTLELDYARLFLERLIALDLDASWCTPNGVRLDRLTPDILRLMRRAGFYSVSVGIESGSDRVLTRMKKGTTTQKVARNLEMVRAEGIDAVGFFIIGFPGETREDIEKTLSFSRSLGLTRAAFFTYLPLPGTESWRELESAGRLGEIDWEGYYFWGGSYCPEGLTRDDLLGYLRRAFWGFYLRPAVLWRNRRAFLNLRLLYHLARYLFKRIFPRLSARNLPPPETAGAAPAG
jgi:radical SAM superfamily enzyme YgiQ (UPF0313 family)